jgi:hypothetical protein
MNIFKKVFDTLLPKDKGTAVPGAMGDLLATMGIHELGPHLRSGLPPNVAAGCRKKVVLIPGASRPAFTKEGKPVMARTEASKGGRPYQVMDNLGISVKEWKSRVNDEKRKAAGRWYSGKVAA